MNPILTILTNTDVTSTARKVLLSAGSIAAVKFIPNVELQGGAILLLGAVLQAWSKYDDGRVGAKAAGQAVGAAFPVLGTLGTKETP